jgi:manganese/zinc/iron transport system ATP- binding protein
VSKTALKVSNLTVNYERTPALWDISLEIPTGLLVAIIGPNGAGKSTFMKALLGLLRPLSGTIELLGQTGKKTKKKIAYVPQRESVDWDFPITVLDLVLMGCYGRLGLFHRPGKKEKEKAMAYLEKVGISHLASRQISQLSGGQQQRAFLARSLFQQPDLFFLDEPFAGIDTTSSQVILEILLQLKNEGKTLFVVHHDLESVKEAFDWAVLLNLRLIAYGKTADVLKPEMLATAYGKDTGLFDEAVQLTRQKREGTVYDF